MLKKITLKDYMSHAATEIELAEGLTVLVGPNNCGKSAVVTALEAVARGQEGDFMVRHGAKGCEVTVETTDGHSVTWRRRRQAPSYVVDGQEFARLGRGSGAVPEKVHEALKLPLVEFGDGNTFDVHIARQKAPIFLLGDTPSAAAKFFSASSDASRLIQMQHRHREQVKDRKREMLDVRLERERAEREVAALETLAAARAKFGAVREERRATERAEAEAARLEPLLVRLAKLAARRATAAVAAEKLAPLAPPPAIEPAAELERTIRRLETLAAATRTARARAGKFATAALPVPPPLVSTAEVERAVVELDRKRTAIERQRAAASRAGAEVERIRREIAAWAAAHPQCPLCGGEVDAARLIHA